MADSFRTDDSMIENSRVDGENPMKLSARRMETIEEDADGEIRKTDTNVSNPPDSASDVRKKPKLTAAASLPVDLPTQ